MMKGPVLVRLVSWANGAPLQCAGEYLRDINVQKADKSEYWLKTTKYKFKARKFKSPLEVFTIWKEVLQSDPVRPDGKPNRPFTALNIEIVAYNAKGPSLAELVRDSDVHDPESD